MVERDRDRGVIGVGDIEKGEERVGYVGELVWILLMGILEMVESRWGV